MTFCISLRAAVLSVFLLVSSAAFAQSFLFNRSDFTTGIQPGGVGVADFNGDGALDVAITDSFAQTVTIYLGQTNGTFKEFVTYPAGYETGSVVVGDFNKDGKVDLAVANWIGSSVSVYLGNGN